MNMVFDPLPNYAYVDHDRRLVIEFSRLEDFARYVDAQLARPMAELLDREAFVPAGYRSRRKGKR